jgi:DNA-binding Lrp family transcriptional regulator
MNTARPKLDQMDLRILCHLQKNGRAVNAVIADAVGLSPVPCQVRMRRLEQAGYIASYGAQIRLEKLSDTLVVFTEVTLRNRRREDSGRFETSIHPIDEIVECHLVSGPYDYLLKFITRGLGHYEEVMERLLERNIGIESYFSYIAVKTPFVKEAYLIERLIQLDD